MTLLIFGVFVVWQVVICETSFRRTECYDGKGLDYIGAVNVTVEGMPCVSWNHKDLFNGERTIYQSIMIENLVRLDGTANHANCRNPTAAPFLKPFCFTELKERLPKFNECPIPHCEEYYANEAITFYCYKGKGSNYRGSITVTSTGKKCMQWDTQLKFINDDPHRQRHVRRLYDTEGWISHASCRNPDPEFRTKPWCYLDMDYNSGKDLRWEYCPIPLCDHVCAESPFVCQNHGICMADAFDFRCECLPGYYGRICEIPLGVKPVTPPRVTPPWTIIEWLSNFPVEKTKFPIRTTQTTKKPPEEIPKTKPKTKPTKRPTRSTSTRYVPPYRKTTTVTVIQPKGYTTTKRPTTAKPNQKDFWSKLKPWHYAVGALMILLFILLFIIVVACCCKTHRKKTHVRPIIPSDRGQVIVVKDQPSTSSMYPSLPVPSVQPRAPPPPPDYLPLPEPDSDRVTNVFNISSS